MTYRFGVSLLSAAVVASLGYVRDARACGGCFHGPVNQNQTISVVTAHRMALSISTTETILWDQVRYSGDPGEFAWVLPVHDGVKVELGHDAWLAALDAVTDPQIQSPPTNCGFPQSSQSSGGGGGGGCGASTTSAEFSSDSFGGVMDSSVKGNHDVTVVTQETVGPYEAVVLRSTNGDAIDQWLLANGYAIPTAIAPLLTQYTKEGFDFLALKLRPNVGVNAMQPVRIRMPGAGPTLPLRMVAAGVGQNVGLELYVLGEGRWEAKSFDNATINDTQLVWDGRQSSSNYATLFDALTKSKPLWVTELASNSPFGSSGTFFGTTALESAYQQTCQGRVETVACPVPDGGVSDSSIDDASSDANELDGSMTDASPDSGGNCMTEVPACDRFDDYRVATANLHKNAMVVRLRTTLPASALATDLVLQPEGSQRSIERLHVATAFVPGTNPCPASAQSTTGESTTGGSSGCACETFAGQRVGDATTAGLMALAIAAVLRRRARR